MQWRHAVLFFFHFFFLPIFKWMAMFGLRQLIVCWNSGFFLSYFIRIEMIAQAQSSAVEREKRNKCSMFDQPFLKCLFSYLMRQTVYQRRSTTISNASSQKHKNNKLSLSFSFGQKGVHQHITMISWALFLCLKIFKEKKKCVCMSSETKHHFIVGTINTTTTIKTKIMKIRI